MRVASQWKLARPAVLVLKRPAYEPPGAREIVDAPSPADHLLGDHAVDALVAVDHLGDLQVGLQAAQHVGVGGATGRSWSRSAGSSSRSASLAASSRSWSKPWVIQCVAVSARGMLSFMSLRTVKRKVPAERGLERGQVDLAVALHAVAVAGREQAALGEHRQVDRGAAPEVPLSMLPPKARGSIELHWRRFRRRCHAHDAEERRQLDLESPRQGADAAIGRSALWVRRWNGKSSGSVPASGRMRGPAPVGAALDRSRTSIASTSPGSAPSTVTGPVRMWRAEMRLQRAQDRRGDRAAR